VQCNYFLIGLVSDYIRIKRRREAASHAIESDEDEDESMLTRTIEMERVRRAVRQRRVEENELNRGRFVKPVFFFFLDFQSNPNQFFRT